MKWIEELELLLLTIIFLPAYLLWHIFWIIIFIIGYWRDNDGDNKRL